MQTCEATGPPFRCRHQRGFSYLILLFALALGGVGLAALGERWQVAMQREREAELLFRGGEIRKAIERYAAVSMPGSAAFPEGLAELVEDRRQPEPRYHLRRLYLDPFTGAADWLVLRSADGQIIGVHSRSHVLALARHNVPATVQRAANEDTTGPVRVGDWWFLAGAAEASP